MNENFFVLLSIRSKMFSSGRTSRREIRKLLWECIFWRFKRAKAHHRASQMAAHSFLDDDDEDETDRSAVTNAYYASSMQGQGRLICSSRSNSNVDSVPHHSRLPSSSSSSLFTCCGFTIDMSQKKQSHPSSPKSPRTSSFRHSTLSKGNMNNHNHYSPAKTRRSTQLSPSCPSYNRQFKREHSTSYQWNDSNSCRPTTVVHCFQQHSPGLPMSSNQKLPMSVVVESDSRLKSQNQRHSSIEPLPPVTTSSSSIMCNSHLSLTNDPNPISTLLQTKQLKNEFEELLPAYIVETC